MATACEIVTAIDTAIQTSYGNKVTSYEIDGVKVQLQSQDELLETRKYYAALCNGETAVTNSRPPIGITGLKAGSGK